MGCVYSMRAVRARGGAPFTLGIGALPLIAHLRQHVVPPQPPSQSGFGVHPPNPFKWGFLALCFPSQFDTFHSKPQLRWIVVVLWVLAARATRRKRFQQATHPSHPVRVARSVFTDAEKGHPGKPPEAATVLPKRQHSPRAP